MEVSTVYNVTKVAKKRGFHHGSLRQALIDAAVELVGEHGPHGFNMREAARRAGVSSGAPYRHFEDQTVLMKAVAAEGTRKMLAQMDAAAAAAGDDARDRFRARGVEYVKFAVANPAYFRVMNIPEYNDPPTTNSAVQNILDGPRDRAVYAADPEVAFLAAQCLVHGLARMFIDGQLMSRRIGPDQVEQIAVAVTEVLDHGLAPRSGDR